MLRLMGLKRLMETNPTYCLTIKIIPFRKSDLLVACGSLIREVRQAARLGELVGVRNGIGHGAILSAPGKRLLDELITYTESLIIQYAEVVLEWITIYEDPEKEKAA